MRRALTIAALAAAAFPAAAEARSARFVAYLEGRQVTTWEQPRHQVGVRDCKGALFSTASGSETITFRTKPARVRISTPGVTVKYGAWSRFGAGKPALKGTGKVTRLHTETLEYEPGPCGAPPPPAPKPHDCGSVDWKPAVRFEWRGDRVSVVADDPELRFALCPVFSPDGVLNDDFTEGIERRFAVRDLFDESQKLHAVRGRKTFSDEIEFGTTTSTITWKLRLRRGR